jgi:uncharacterized membrane protein YdbT with pleckstrin-like domain
MAYPEKLLAEDEKIVEHLHPHWITLVAPVGALILICGLFGAGFAALPDGSAHQPLLLALLGVCLVLIVWLTVWPVLGWRATHYVLTSHRVMIRRGVLNHTGRDIPLVRINDVAYEQTIWDRLVGAGTLTIASASEYGQEILKFIPKADMVQQTINRLVEADAARRSGQHDTN